MDSVLLNFLVDPISKQPLTLETRHHDPNGHVMEGVLRAPDGRSYPITNGIPRFVLTDDQDQEQTKEGFAFKWQQRLSYGSPAMQQFGQRWVAEKYGFQDVEEMRAAFGQHQRILDVGCGGGYTTKLWLEVGWQTPPRTLWIGMDISAAIDVAQEALHGIPNTHFVQADLMQMPFAPETFDLIFSEGVLHHTPSTRQAIAACVPLLTKGGEFAFYVYRQKGAIREFTDDYIRSVIADLSPQAAWEALRPLTRLGQALAELKVEVRVPEDIPFLGIRAGTFDLQRLFYWHFAKAFWNPDFSFEENHHINFDWYYPRYAHRQSEEELRAWCEELNLRIIHFHTQESGFTVRAIKD